MSRLTNFLWLAGGMLLGCLALVIVQIIGGGKTAHAQAGGTQKPNILFIMAMTSAGCSPASTIAA